MSIYEPYPLLKYSIETWFIPKKKNRKYNSICHRCYLTLPFFSCKCKYYCRRCGYVFCNNCSNIINVEKGSFNNVGNKIKKIKKMRICASCSYRNLYYNYDKKKLILKFVRDNKLQNDIQVCLLLNKHGIYY